MTCRLRRAANRAAYRVLQVWWFVRRPTIRGVKLVIEHDGRVLFVRHAYGDRTAWELPGGGVKTGETAAAAAAREAYEELGLRISGWRHFGDVEVTIHATARMACLHAEVTDISALELQFSEIAEHVWAPFGSEPKPLGRTAGPVLAALRETG